ncbi:O-antigen ligase family protein [Terrimonas alba]|uniref:O-antigen ligase family protein n=1 Tax=Terrimonas alba TaxID=3349636 RepID=UPI0035F3FA29
MKLYKLQDSLRNKISLYHLVLFLMLLPFDRFYSEIIVISFVLHTFIHLSKPRFQQALNWQTLTVYSVFLVSVTALLWTAYVKEGLQDLEHQLVILLFPLAFSVSDLNLVRYKQKLLLLFAATCVATILYLYIDAIRIIIYHHLPLGTLLSSSFLNHNFSAPIGMHATYLSMYVSLSIALLLYSFLKTNSKINRMLLALGMAILLAGLLQLASKSVLIASILFIIPGFISLLPKGIRRKLFIAILLAVLLVTTLAITKIEPLKERYIAEMKEDMGNVSIQNKILEPRIIRWQSALPLIKNRPVFGYGSGSEKELLKEQYFENKLYNSYLHELDIHNQYLSFLIRSGIVGLLIFLATLFAGFNLAWRNKDAVFMSFMTLISIVSLSENILAVNKGIFFYAFFFSLFMITGKNNTVQKNIP